MPGESEPEELQDGFELPSSADGLNHMHLGAESLEDLGDGVEVRTHSEGSGGFFDQIQVVSLAGETVVLAKEAIRADGDAYLLPTQVIPWDEVKDIQVPVDDRIIHQDRLERIGVNQ